MASFISLIRPKISLSRLPSMLARFGHSLPLPKPAPLRLTSHSFCTISVEAGFEDSYHLDPRYIYSHDILALVDEICSLKYRIGQVLSKVGSVTPETVLKSYPNGLLKEIGEVVFWNPFVKQGRLAATNRSEDENNFYIRMEIPGVDVAGLKCQVDEVLNMDFVVYKKEVNLIAVADGEVDPEFGELDVGREYSFQESYPADIDTGNCRYLVNKGVFWMVLPKSVR